MSSKEETLKEGIKAILAGGVAGIVVKDTDPSLWIDLIVDLFIIVIILSLYVAVEHAEGIFNLNSDDSGESVNRDLRPYRVLSSRSEEKQE
ncbi:hypothetical protein [Haloferax sp. Atlit-12N]|uniref:hypothetical protein n=1 Tax=Haloferax sp. Atlit-12N TaxID=2077203 RepID=UPI0011E5F9A3|nr:hypothetical protein [Haloferax sp. Atlit-12N]